MLQQTLLLYQCQQPTHFSNFIHGKTINCIPNVPFPQKQTLGFTTISYVNCSCLYYQVFSAKGKEAIDTAIKSDLIVLNTAVAGKWLDAVLNKDVPRVLPKVLWWIHEMRGHYFRLDYVKHLPMVAGAMIDSYVTAEYWKNRTQERLKIKMPKTHVVHLGNSKELIDVAENSVAKRVLREHVREALGVCNEDILFAAISIDSRKEATSAINTCRDCGE